jgi:hypothetical protein
MAQWASLTLLRALTWAATRGRSSDDNRLEMAATVFSSLKFNRVLISFSLLVDLAIARLI